MATTRVEWTTTALDDWRRLALPQAKAVAVAVERWAERGEGLTIYVDGEFLLFVGDYTIVLLIDGDTVYVDGVRRS
jgi:hypothetical protein